MSLSLYIPFQCIFRKKNHQKSKKKALKNSFWSPIIYIPASGEPERKLSFFLCPKFQKFQKKVKKSCFFAFFEIFCQTGKIRRLWKHPKSRAIDLRPTKGTTSEIFLAFCEKKIFEKCIAERLFFPILIQRFFDLEERCF